MAEAGNPPIQAQGGAAAAPPGLSPAARAALEARAAAKAPVRAAEAERAPIAQDKAHTWPYLVRLEFLSGLILILILMVWSIAVDAPLEEFANPANTPNPSKAPWYFLGLQDMLVYFDPWLAGVVFPGLIIVGLMVIPYVDINPKGNGYYTFKQRPFAILTFFFGFFFLWILLIVLGTFMRGPGWNLFWPGQYWDPHKTLALTNVDLPYKIAEWLGYLGISWYPSQAEAFIVGALAVFGYFSIAGIFWFLKKDRPWMKQLGFVRYNIVAILFLTMMSLPIKMILRFAFNIKYVWVTPWFNI
jgi:hypothetical protein